MCYAKESREKRAKKGVVMKVGISVGIWGKEHEFCWGKANAKYAIVELSGTVLTAKVAIYVKV